MQFIDYILDSPNVLTKSSCSKDCQFKDNHQIPIVGIPTINSIQGVIISRDPTTAFIEPYLLARLISQEDWHHKLMTADAPPQWVIKQIETFNQKYLEEDYKANIGQLKKLMENNIYWTHLHKCCTDKSAKEAPSFNAKNARLCANKWLDKELKEAIDAGAEFIICVGNDARSWLQEWESGQDKTKIIPIFYLPHPSGAANGAWNPKDIKKLDDLKNTIESLLRLSLNIS